MHYFDTPLTKIFNEFKRHRAVLEGETKKNECRVWLDAVHLEIRRAPRVLTIRIYERTGISGERNVVEMTELTLWEKFLAFRLMRRLHNYSRANVRLQEMQELSNSLMRLR